jgi:surface protein
MNNLAFQIYGTKKATPFQSVWDTTITSPLGNELTTNLTATAPLTNWALAPGGTSLLTGGYTHTVGSTALLLFNLVPITVQRYQMQYTITGTGSVVINFGGVSSAPLTAGTNVIITLTTINSNALSIAPDNNFTGNIRLSIKQSASASNQIQLPINIASGKSIWIDWGDGQYNTANSGNIIQNRLHTYTIPGEYTVRVLGDAFGFGFGNPPNSNLNDRRKIKSVSSWGKLKIGTNSFNGCVNVTMSGITDIPDLTGVTSLSNTFNTCSLLTTVGRINEWNTSSVTDMSGTFSSCPLFNSNIGNWNTSEVINMSNMFGSFNSASNFNQDISGWNVSKVTNMNQMFDYATSFNQNLSNWERSGSSLSKVIFMSYMFRGASNFNNGFALGVANQLPWNTSACTTMESMFVGATAFNSNLGTGTTPWNVSKVTTFISMFNGASNFNNGDENDITKSKINDWNVGGSVTSVSISSMFRSASKFNRNISNWNVSKVTSTSTMFFGASAFNQPLANWERSTVGNVSTISNMTNLYAMFQGASAFNQNIGNWNVTKVTQFAQMFQGSGFNNNGSSDINNWVINTTPGANVLMNGMFVTTGFNQPLDNWNTSEVTTMALMFGQSPFNNGLSLGVAGTLAWNTAKVTRMDGMFGTNSRFNCNIGSWNVNACTNFSTMFQEAHAFNNGGSSSIGTWDINTAADIDMSNMFKSATIFNQDISSWNVSKVTSFSSMFHSAPAFTNGLNQNTNPRNPRIGINGWDINTTPAALVNMGNMFNGAVIFNKDISSWNVSKVTNMFGMFLNAFAFNQPIANWERTDSTLANVTSMYSMFENADSFNQPIGNWNVSKVASMVAMFRYNAIFNEPIGNWNVSNVTDMSYMFEQAASFNQPLSNWERISSPDTSTLAKVTNMAYMFSSNPFNQNIGNWNISNVTNFKGFMQTRVPTNFSTTNLDAIYNGWGSLPSVQPNLSSPLAINISFGGAKYTAASSVKRAVLTSAPNNWIIQDGGITTIIT